MQCIPKMQHWLSRREPVLLTYPQVPLSQIDIALNVEFCHF